MSVASKKSGAVAVSGPDSSARPVAHSGGVAGVLECRAFDRRCRAAASHVAALALAAYVAEPTRRELVAEWPAVIEQAERAAIVVVVDSLADSSSQDAAHDALRALDKLYRRAAPFLIQGPSVIVVRRWAIRHVLPAPGPSYAPIATEDTVETTPVTCPDVEHEECGSW